MRRPAAAAAAIAIVAGAACTSTDDDVADDTDTDTVADTDDAATPDRVVALAGFGWDADAVTPHDVVLEQRTRVPTAWWVVATVAWDGSLVGGDEACVVEAALDSGVAFAPAWAAGEAVLLGVDLVGTVVETRGACEALTGRTGDALAADLTALGWSLGVQEALSDDVAAALTASGADPSAFLGGGLRGGVTDDAYLGIGLTSARGLDPGWFVGDPQAAPALVTDDALGTAWYQIEAGVAWDDVVALLP